MISEDTIPRSVYEKEVDGRTDLIWKMKRAVEMDLDNARRSLSVAIVERNWSAIAGLTILHQSLADLNKKVSDMVDEFAKSE